MVCMCQMSDKWVTYNKRSTSISFCKALEIPEYCAIAHANITRNIVTITLIFKCNLETFDDDVTFDQIKLEYGTARVV